MATPSNYDVPDFDALLGGLLGRVGAEERPLLIAMLERVAAAKYRDWAALPEFQSDAAALRACADREERIAEQAEALYPDAQARQTGIGAALPELAQVPDDLFGNRTPLHQMAVLAAGERAGGRVWAGLAAATSASKAAGTMKAFTAWEDENAEVLESILGRA